MKILFWSTSYLPNVGGLEMVVHSLAAHFKQSGHEVKVISANIRNDELSVYSLDGIEVHQFPFVRAITASNLMLIKKIITKVGQVIDEFSPDLINIHGWYESYSFYQTRVLSARTIPFCVTIHGLLEQETYNTSLCMSILSKAKAVNVVSQSLIDELENMKIHHSRGIKVIYNGLIEEGFSSCPLAPPVLLMIGRLSGEKKFDTMFYALKKLLAQYPDLTLRLIGDGVLYHDLCELRKKLGLENQIKMYGFVSSALVKKHLSEASMLIIPSSYESFGLVALEAAFSGIPVVASYVGGLKEVVLQEESGLLVEEGNVDAFVSAVSLLLLDPERRRKMGEHAKARAKTKFMLNDAAQSYLKMYEETVSA